MRAAILGAAAWAAVGTAGAADPPPTGGKPVDLVLCLDISNSMDGLILSAKAKLWAIVNQFAAARPVPDLRVAVYSYGNDGHDPARGWVRQEVGFSRDLDEVSRVLNGLRTNGGTEYVARVCNSALRELPWADGPALRVLFVCGNEAADQDPQIPFDQVASYARSRGLLVNTIFCGRAEDRDADSYRRAARLAGGRFVHIDQGAVGRERYIPSPYDKELLDLSGKLNGTCVPYGDRKGREKKLHNQLAQDLLAADVAPQAALGRAATKNSGLYRNSDWDLVDRLRDDPKFDCNALKPDELPDDLAKLKPAERTAHLKAKLAERTAINRRVGELLKLQAEFVAREKAKDSAASTPGGKALDEAVRDVVREQAARAGLELPK